MTLDEVFADMRRVVALELNDAASSWHVLEWLEMLEPLREIPRDIMHWYAYGRWAAGLELAANDLLDSLERSGDISRELTDRLRDQLDAKPEPNS